MLYGDGIFKKHDFSKKELRVGLSTLARNGQFEIAFKVKLPAQRAGLPGKVILFYIVPLDPAYLPTGTQGGACGARSGQRFLIKKSTRKAGPTSDPAFLITVTKNKAWCY
jgi:hypothetical protein